MKSHSLVEKDTAQDSESESHRIIKTIFKSEINCEGVVVKSSEHPLAIMRRAIVNDGRGKVDAKLLFYYTDSRFLWCCKRGFKEGCCLRFCVVTEKIVIADEKSVETLNNND